MIVYLFCIFMKLFKIFQYKLWDSRPIKSFVETFMNYKFQETEVNNMNKHWSQATGAPVPPDAFRGRPLQWLDPIPDSSRLQVSWSNHTGSNMDRRMTWTLCPVYYCSARYDVWPGWPHSWSVSSLRVPTSLCFVFVCQSPVTQHMINLTGKVRLGCLQVPHPWAQPWVLEAPAPFDDNVKPPRCHCVHQAT